jgi:signal transduction histidine kinase
MIDDITDLSRLHLNKFTLNKDWFNLYECFYEVIDILKLQADLKMVPLILMVDDDVPTFIRSDKKRIKQVLNNLIGNSVKFTF